MKRFIAALTLAGCLSLACGLVAFAAPAKTGARAGAANTISGVVVNATRQNAVVANQKVILQRSAGNTAQEAQDIATTVTGQDGRFSFGNITASADATFAVYTQFQGGMFSSQTVSLGDGAATALQLKVYDTTNDDAHLRVTVATMLVRQPRPVNGLIGIGEVISIENTGATAFVGTPTGDANKPMRLLRFATPPNASNLSLGIGFAGSQIITTDKGFGSTATVPPGTTEFAFGIDIPYTGTAADLAYKAVYPTARVIALVPPDMFVNGKDFQAQGIIDSLGSRYQLFTVASAAAGKQVSLELSGLPMAGETSNLDASALTILAAILALLALLALILYLWRGDRLAAALGLVPRHAPASGSVAPATMVASKDIGTSERDQLLRELLTLERSHTSGAVSDADFGQRNRALRLRLREVLASEQPASPLTPGAREFAEASLAPGADAGAGLQDAAEPQETAPEQSSGGRR